ncbi:MAG: hypothetical protein LBR15_04255 [Methanobrevibacter sp.]|jgi:hypothetical protein|nr:hypothetical protein [Candidatus Methanovirga australis]
METIYPYLYTDGREFYKHSLLNKYSEAIQPHPTIKEWKTSKTNYKILSKN